MLELPDNASAALKQPGNVRNRAIAKPNPDTFRRRTEEQGPLPEILILRDNNEAVCGSKFPDFTIIGIR